MNKEYIISRLQSFYKNFMLLDRNLCGYFIPNASVRLDNGSVIRITPEEAEKNLNDLMYHSIRDNIIGDDEHLRPTILHSTPYCLRSNADHVLTVLELLDRIFKYEVKSADNDDVFNHRNKKFQTLLHDYMNIVDLLSVTESFCIGAMKKSNIFFKYLPKAYKSDPCFLIRMAAESEHILDGDGMKIIRDDSDVNYSSFSNEEKKLINLAALSSEKNNDNISNFVNDSSNEYLLNDRDFCIMAVRVNERIYPFLKDKFRFDKRVALEAIEENPMLLDETFIGVRFYRDSSLIKEVKKKILSASMYRTPPREIGITFSAAIPK